jgi:hypothetical protein
VEASRKHGSFETRWPCARRDSLGALSTAPLPPRLSLVTTEPASTAVDPEAEDAGTQRLLVALAAMRRPTYP